MSLRDFFQNKTNLRHLWVLMFFFCVCVFVCVCVCVSGVFHTLCQRQFLRARRSAVLWGSLSHPPRVAVFRLSETHHGPLHHSHGQEVSSWAFCLCLLSQAAQQGHLQRAKRQALLPGLLHQALQLERCLTDWVCVCVCKFACCIVCLFCVCVCVCLLFRWMCLTLDIPTWRCWSG